MSMNRSLTRIAMLAVSVAVLSWGLTAQAITYNDSAAGNWNASATWGVASGYPIAGDAITKDGSFTVTVTGAEEFGGTGINSTWSTAGTQGSNVLSINSGQTLTHLSGGTFTYTGHGPNITGSGTFINQGTFVHQGNAAGGDLDLYAKFNNFGTYEFTGTQNLQFVQMDGGSGIWRNESGGLITKTGSTYDAGFWDYNETNGAQFINDGGNITLPTGGGLLYIQDGKNATPHQSTGGTFSTAAGTTLELSGYWSEITADATGGGDVLVASATNGNLEVPTGGLTVNVSTNGVKWTSGTVDLNAGQTLTNAGIFTVAGGGTKTLAGTGTFLNTGTLTVDSSTTFAVPSGIGLALNAGTINGSGTVELGSSLTSTGSSTLSGVTLDLAGDTRTVSVTGSTLNVTSKITNGGLTKTGGGTLTFSGGTANDYTGDTTVNGGTLNLTKSSGVTSIAGDLIIDSGVVLLNQNHQIANTSNITTNGSAYINTNNRSDTVASMTLNSSYATYDNYRLSNLNVTGTLEMTDGTAGLNSNASLSAGTLLMSGGSQINFAANSGNTTLNIGSGGLTMDTATLHLGWGTLPSSQTAWVKLGGDFTGSGTNLFDYYTTDNNRWLDLMGATRTFDITSGTTTIQPTIRNGGLTKTGAGTLVFSGTPANTYTGLTTVSAGMLELNKTGSIAIAGDVLIDGGTLKFTGTNQVADTASITLDSGRLLTGTDTIENLTINSTNGSGDTYFHRLTITDTLTVAGGVPFLGSGTTTTANKVVMTTGGEIEMAANGGPTTFNIGSGGLSMSDAVLHLGYSGLTSGYTALVNLGGDVTGSGTNSIEYYNTNGARLLDLQGATRTFDVTSGTTTIDATVQNGGLTKTGTGTLELNGSNTFAGPLSVKAGTLETATVNNQSADGPLGNSTSAVSLGDTGGVSGTLQYTGATASSNKKFTMATGGTGVFQIDNAGTALTLTGLINGGGGLTKTGDGTLIFNGATTYNSYTGTTNVVGGQLRLLGSGSIDGDVVVHNGATLWMQSGTDGIADSADVTINTGGFIELLENENVNGLFGGGTIDRNTTGSHFLGIRDGAFSGTIQDTQGSIRIEKIGNGSLTLSGVNSYSGTTIVKDGTLLVEGTHNGGGLYTVQSGGTLGGSGDIFAPVTVQSGATLSPGSSYGILEIGGGSNNVTLASGSSFLVEIGGATAGLGYDQLLYSGAGTLNIGGALLEVLGTPLASLEGETFFIVNSTSSSATLSGLFTDPLTSAALNDGDQFSSVSSGFQLTWRIDYSHPDSTDGNDVALTLLSVVPEPATALVWSLLAALAIGLGRRRRK